MLIVIGVYLIVFVTLSQYGIHQLKGNMAFCCCYKEVDLPGYFLENLDGIVMAASGYGIYTPYLSPCFWNHSRRYFQYKNP